MALHSTLNAAKINTPNTPRWRSSLSSRYKRNWDTINAR